MASLASVLYVAKLRHHIEISCIDRLNLVILDLHLYFFAYEFFVVYDVCVRWVGDGIRFELDLEAVFIINF